MPLTIANKRIDQIAPVYDAQGNVVQLLLSISYDLVDATGSMPNLVQRIGTQPDVWPLLNAGQKTAFIQVLTRLEQIKGQVTPS